MDKVYIRDLVKGASYYVLSYSEYITSFLVCLFFHYHMWLIASSA